MSRRPIVEVGIGLVWVLAFADLARALSGSWAGVC
jgi:hypothetical protein